MKRHVALLVALFPLVTLTPQLAVAQQLTDADEAVVTLEAPRPDRPIRNLALAPEDLGPNWAVVPGSVEEVDVEHLGRPAGPSDPLALFQARYRNETDFEPGRETAFLIAEFQSPQQAEKALREYLDYFLMNRMPEVRWRWLGEEVATGDTGVRFGYGFSEAFTAGYLFRVDTYLGGVLVRGSEAEEEDLLADATTVTSWQEALLTSGTALAQSAR
jgi:hypothetical protein